MSYDQQYYAQMLRKTLLGRFKGDRRLQHRAWLRYLKRAGVESVLEIGCGLGFFGKYALKRQIDYVGIDISRYAIRVARILHGPHFQRAAQPQQSGKPVQCAVAFDVFEHLQQDELTQILFQLRELLEPHSMLVFTTPNPASISRKFSEEDWFAYKDDTHVNIQEKDYWISTCAEAGFSCEISGSDFPWDFHIGNSLLGVQRALVTLTYKGWMLFFGPYSRHLHGDNLVFVMRKQGYA